MKNILVADDEEFIRRLFSKVLSHDSLQQLGVKLHFAANGEEALRIASTVPLDIITMDISMPVKSGVQATREIRARPELYGKPKIIAVTGIGEKKEAIEAGCDDYLAKPVTNQELLETVLGYLDQSRKPVFEPDPSGKRVMLIDIDHGSLYWAQKALRAAGYVPVLAEGVADALKALRYGSPPRLVLVDSSSLDGASAGDHSTLLQHLEKNGVPIVLRGEEGETQAHTAGWIEKASGRVPRKATPEELVKCVSSLLG